MIANEEIMEIKVSVVTPMYNSATYLSNCIESFLNQTLEDCEIILVDDASPDDSFGVAEKYKNLYPDKIKLLQHKKNLRAGGARNTGLKAARGKYVCFLDADDWLDRTILEKCYKVAESEECEIVDCDYYECTSEEDEKKKYVISMPEETVGVQNDNKIEKNIVNGGRVFTKIFLREMLILNELYYPEKLRYEDNGVGPLMCCKAKKIGKVREALYFYRVDNSFSQMGNVITKAAFEDRLLVGEYLLNLSKKCGVFDRYNKGIEYRFIELYYASNLQIYVRGNFEVKDTLLVEMRKLVKTEFPKYKNNAYIKAHFVIRYKMCCFTNEYGVWLFNIYRSLFKVVYFWFKYIHKLLGRA